MVSARRVWLDLLVYPTYTLPVAVAPVLVGVGLAAHNGAFRLLPALIGFLASWLLHVGGVMLDNYELLVRHPDNREHPDLVEALHTGALSLPVLRGAIAFCFAVPMLTGPYFLHVAGYLVVAFGILGVVSSWGYAGAPLAYARWGLADPIFFVMFGVVAVVGTYYVEAAPLYLSHANRLLVLRALPLDAFVLGLPIGALVTNMMLIDDLRDRAPDRVKGWRTGAVRFGPAWSRIEIGALMAFSYLAPFWFWLGLGFSPWVLLPLLILPQAVAMMRVVCSDRRFDELFPLAPKIAAMSFYYGALLGIGVAVR
ncbi:MAG: UbiA family prenyltransferase [Alphaproteobacteria bacterium]|nr:UbiA family prenyltransferase [Alphaproteobacteria bacterium]